MAKRTVVTGSGECVAYLWLEVLHIYGRVA